MRTIYTILFFILGIFIHTYAQPPVLTVLITDGNALFEPVNAVSKKELLIGDEISNGNIILKEKSFISLIHESGNIIELSEQGIYNTNLLVQKLSAKPPAPVTKQLARDFLIDNYAQLREKYHPVTGSISRFPRSSFHIFQGSLTTMIKDSVSKIYWSRSWKKGHEISFNIALTNLFGDTILSSSIKDTVFEVFPAHKEKIKENHLILIIANTEHPDDNRDIRINVLTKKEETEYLTTLKQLNKELINVKISSFLLLYIFYEKNHCALQQASCVNALFTKLGYPNNSYPGFGKYFGLNYTLENGLKKSGYMRRY